MRTDSTAASPNRHTMAAFTFMILLPLVYYIPPWLTRHVSDNHLLVTVLALAIIVPVMSYVALPLFIQSFTKLNVVRAPSENN